MANKNLNSKNIIVCFVYFVTDIIFDLRGVSYVEGETYSLHHHLQSEFVIERTSKVLIHVLR